jgi:LDH2 family malate/lactate/ureidoglycolate dehydrogenase
MSVKIQYDNLKKFMKNILIKIGMDSNSANIVSDSLIFANLRGIDSHGVIRFPFYLKRLIDGGTNIKPTIKTIHKSTGTVLLDGDNGMGQVVGTYAADLALKNSAETGVCFIGVRGSSHYGAAQYYTCQIAQKNCIGFSSTSSGVVMAPWGGLKRMIGNNPLSIAVPYLENQILVLDISMSKVAGGKVRLAAKNNKKIPFNWILNENGEPTNNPHDLGSKGSLLPFAEHKGYGMAFMLEILCSALTGAAMLGSKPSWIKDTKTSLNMGHIFGAINISMFIEKESFRERVCWIVNELKSSTLTKDRDSDEILVPGELEWKMEEERKKNGIPISDEVLSDFIRLGKNYNETLEK